MNPLRPHFTAFSIGKAAALVVVIGAIGYGLGVAIALIWNRCTTASGEAVICGTVYAVDGVTPIIGTEIQKSTASGSLSNWNSLRIEVAPIITHRSFE